MLRPAPRPRVRRLGVLGVFTVSALAAGALLGAPAAGADEPPTPEPTTTAPAGRTVMGAFSAEAYAAQAAATPPELADALQAGLGLSPAEYYAQADAAATGVEVVDELRASGVDVLASRLEGTQLVLTVADETAAAAVAETGAVAELGSAPVRSAQPVESGTALRDLVGGQGYYWVDGTWVYYCSVGVNGLSESSSAEFLSAGHCGQSGHYVNFLEQNRPDQDEPGWGDPLGNPIAAETRFGEGYDVSAFETYTSNFTPRAAVGTWKLNRGSVTSGTPVTVRDYSRAVVGQGICKSGRTSGWTCGTVTAVDEYWEESSTGAIVNAFTSTMCALPGDSGGAVMSGSNALGVLSLGQFEQSCSESGKLTGSFPIDSPYENAFDIAPGWQPLVELAKPASPVLGGGAPLYAGSPVTGTVAGGGPHHSVLLTIDGGDAEALPVSKTGVFSAPSTVGLTPGTHTFSMRTSYLDGRQQTGAVSGSFLVAERPAVSRIGGATRFDVAVAIADAAFPTTAPVVYVATGYNYPDALSAGPAATTQGGPLLTVLTDGVPDVVAAKLTALKPQRIVIVGGVNAVNASVETTLKSLVPTATVERIAGADRYAVSRAVVKNAFGTAAHAYVSTGGNFPDALSAGGAAGSKGEPVVLVNGGAASADAATVKLLGGLKTTSLSIVGGPNSVSTGVEGSLRTGVPAAVDRFTGSDRFATSVALNTGAFQTAGTVYLATGYNFPDALAGGVLAGISDSPLFVVPTDCVPRAVLGSITSMGASEVVLLGGDNALKPAVADLTPCAF
ncbi:cell wall-binding repeat-containing protein [Herbiconiux sp. CPCC 205716]|uniref:Cell wall-binding repeat-containing protein n=1 Tax=Herbiconiux gentiana TaxID=2970912 RepID=A0ABT2GD01_9MICO|nr:cell wall-binding repeat-containing protein [Herbiconiux gentiana]MCS5713991.1 cell wall-binding repeat-containing protein [Herbiconiux gentiana]